MYIQLWGWSQSMKYRGNLVLNQFCKGRHRVLNTADMSRVHLSCVFLFKFKCSNFFFPSVSSVDFQDSTKRWTGRLGWREHFCGTILGLAGFAYLMGNQRLEPPEVHLRRWKRHLRTSFFGEIWSIVVQPNRLNKGYLTQAHLRSVVLYILVKCYKLWVVTRCFRPGLEGGRSDSLRTRRHGSWLLLLALADLSTGEKTPKIKKD